MAPSQKSNSKGKSVDLSTEWSDWIWDTGRGCYYASRYNTYGEVEYEYRYADATQTQQQQAETPRSPGENVFSTGGSTLPYSNRASYTPQATPYSRGAEAPEGSEGSVASAYQTSLPAGTDSYYTTATSAGSDTTSRSAGVNYSPSSTTSSTLYASSKSNYGSSGRDYDGASDVTTAMRGMSLARPPTIPEQENFDAPNIIRRPADREDREKLDPRYRVIPDKEQKKFWKVGRVFMMLWTEPAKSQNQQMGGTRNGTHYSTVWLEQGAYSEIRRFVVIKEGYGNSICSPIHTYNGQATLKPNLPERQQHAIIYTSQDCPPEHSYVANDGSIVKENLSKDPIKVHKDQKGPEGDLGVYSRLNYSKIYTVENYVRVLSIGMVERDWLPTLIANSHVKPSETLGPVEKPTNHKPPKDSNKSPRDSGGAHKKGKESRRSRR
ncbi:hypothetical protein G7Y89_g4181 [Cudoniella acicularis]|uniref:DUF6590 domain-containing protein n=1 Tax=Cudoniella acicularis TaxID=354080 RepID=A0A8H4W7P6_9HELO|nr:hypothetical protein G7Y89_g4181 [Cudoniella acicularis]